MRNVVIIGAGGAASEVTFYIEDHNKKVSDEEKIALLGYVDYTDEYCQKYRYEAPWLGDIETYAFNSDAEVLIAIGDVPSRRKMIDRLQAKGVRIGSFIHSSVIMPDDLEIGEGNIVMPFCVLEKHAVIGNYNFLTSYSFISHECVVGDNNFFSVAGVAGSVSVGNDNYFGIRSVVIPGVKIGNHNVIQAGMVVDKNVGDGTTVFYRFKEKVLAIPKKV